MHYLGCNRFFILYFSIKFQPEGGRTTILIPSLMYYCCRVIESCGLSGLGQNGFSDPYAQVVILGPAGFRYVGHMTDHMTGHMTITCRSEVRKGLIHRKDNDPQMNETFFFPVSVQY